MLFAKLWKDVAASHCDRVPIVRIEDASLLTENPTDVDRLAADSATVLDIEGRAIMYVGNLQPYQGIDLLLDAFTHVYHRVSDAQLVIIGGDAGDIKRYRAVAQSHSISERTHFLGPRPVDQLGAYLEQAEILVSPRTMGNNTPMKVFSYLESGIPVLATKLDMHTQVLDNEIALLVDATPLEMARGMCSLLEDRELREQVSLAAQDRMRTEFCATDLAMKLTEFYDETGNETWASRKRYSATRSRGENQQCNAFWLPARTVSPGVPYRTNLPDAGIRSWPSFESLRIFRCLTNS